MFRLLILCTAASAFAASQMESPSLGWLWDQPSNSLRRLAGLPGALRNEPGIQLPEGTAAVWLSPSQDMAVLALPNDQLERRNLITGESTTIDATRPEQVIFSLDGKQVGLWSKSKSTFSLWGESPVDLTAKSIALRNDGEILFLEPDGVLRSSKSAWIGSFGADAIFTQSDSRLTIATLGAFIVFERNATNWIQRSRRDDDRITAFTQIELEFSGSLLSVDSQGQLLRWNLDSGASETLAASGIAKLQRLRQPGFYLADGESLQLVFALSESQKIYSLPVLEVRQ